MARALLAAWLHHPFFEACGGICHRFVNASGPFLPNELRFRGCCGQDGGVGGGAEGGAEAVETFNTEASIRAMAALMEQLFWETGNDRFDTAYNRLLQPPHAHV